MEQIGQMLRKVPIFRELDELEYQKIEEITILHTYQRKSNVFMEGEPRRAVFFILEGIVKVYKTDVHGNEHIVNFLKPGDMFPHVGFFDQSPYPATTEVVEPTELCVIPIKSFEQTIIGTPTIAIKVMRVLGEKILELQAKLQDFGVHDVNYRIVSLLLRLANEHGTQEGNQVQINLPLTHQEFANMLGTTRETVNRLFNQLKKARILTVQRRKIVIQDVHALEQQLMIND